MLSESRIDVPTETCNSWHGSNHSIRNLQMQVSIVLWAAAKLLGESSTVGVRIKRAYKREG